MRRTRTSTLAAGAALAIAMIGAPTAMAAGGSTIMVDGDGRATPASCNDGAPGSARVTVQGGVNAAQAGDTVLVCPGTYVEQVQIAGKDGLTVRSTRPWKATIQAPTDLDAPFIVGIYGADDVTLQWFNVVTRPTEGCDAPVIGILALAGRDITIRSNRVRNLGRTLGPCAFTFGIMAGYPLGFSTSSAALPAGLLPGDLTTTATIINNAVRDHVGIGIAAVSTLGPTAGGTYGPTRADILNNSVRYYHLGSTNGDCTPVTSTSLSARETRSIRRSISAIPAGPGIGCEAIGIYQGATISDSPIPGPAGVIRGNRISSGPDAATDLIAGAEPATPAQAIGILIIDQRHSPGASQVLDNLVFRNVFGILAVDAAGVEIRENRSRSAFFGIAVWDTEGAIVRDNIATDGVVGVIVSDEPFFASGEAWYVTDDVRFRDNDARGNADRSCVDDTLGDGTLGTDNTWIGNLGELDSSDPAGICGGVTPP